MGIVSSINRMAEWVAWVVTGQHTTAVQRLMLAVAVLVVVVIPVCVVLALLRS